jgi:D-glycero-D-manno-heptose 1,7-bisphosphate phosphatase
VSLVILDRDGVVNVDNGEPITQVADWEPIPGSLEAIGRLYKAGHTIAIATNQSGVGRGLLELDTLHEIHRKMHEAALSAGGRIELVAFCPHTESDKCDCRKPAPGMLYTLSERAGVDLVDVTLVGDSLRDMQAAMAAAAKPVLVRTGSGQQTLDNNKGLEHIPAFDDLSAWADAFLEPA